MQLQYPKSRSAVTFHGPGKGKKLKYSLVLQFIVEPNFGCLKSSGSDSGQYVSARVMLSTLALTSSYSVV